ncbi:peptidase domain-containing ABC transporter [Dyadobacter crusticola]|uniref:peptidase domain-containing ABC transporter n=1 Tax=Dyadobacter crusticola TaxID=292407 RepID=UPI00146FC034|nr:peptidase domain-containing ABC transporter [Dyadobacter crusticola]
MIRKAFTMQTNQTDCGVACLLTIIKYYKGVSSFETIRRLSGTSTTGTTLLGLYQAANKLGFDTQGIQTNCETLIQNNYTPAILYFNSNHFVVFFGYAEPKQNGTKLVIGDPATGLKYLSESELDELWQTKKCLILSPNEKFKHQEELKNQKREWIKGLLRKDVPLLTIASVMGVLISVLGLSMAVFSQKLIDNILPKKDEEKLYLGIFVVFVLLIVKECFSYLRGFYLLKQSKDFNTRVSDFFYSHLLYLPKVFFDSRKTGDLTARLNDTQKIQGAITRIAGSVLTDVFVLISSTVFVFIYSWQIGLFCLVSIPLFFLLVNRSSQRIQNAQRNIMASYALAESNYISTLQGIDTIRGFNLQQLFAGDNKRTYGHYQNDILLLGKVQIRLTYFANLLAIVFVILVLLFACTQVLSNKLKAGELIAILGMCGTLLPSVANLALISVPITEAKIAFERMFEFTGIETESDPDTQSIRNEFSSLKVCNLSFRFPGRNEILRDASFEVAKGEIIAIMGENGCGKSTLTQIIQRNYQFERGQVIVNDHIDLTALGRSDWNEVCVSVPQNIHIFNGTIADNITLANPSTTEFSDFVTEHGLGAFLDSFPQSMMTIVGEEGINLSGGQKQMLAIARALYTKPELLIMDEATSAMDRQSEQFVLDLLGRLRTKMAIIFITHRLHVLKSLVDRIYILDNGVITATGNHSELLQSSNLYSKYWNDLV